MICYYSVRRKEKRFNPWRARGTLLWVLTSLEVAMFSFWTCLWLLRRIEQFTGQCFASPRTSTYIFPLQVTTAFCPCKLEGLWNVSEGTRVQRKLPNTSKFSRAGSRTEALAWNCLNVCARSFSLRAKSEISREGGSVLLKAPYNKNISTKWFQKQLQRHLALLQQVVPSCPVRPCWSVRKRLFRLRYRGIWKTFEGKGCGWGETLFFPLQSQSGAAFGCQSHVCTVCRSLMAQGISRRAL